jgi:hypothetical protein
LVDLKRNGNQIELVIDDYELHHPTVVEEAKEEMEEKGRTPISVLNKMYSQFVSTNPKDGYAIELGMYPHIIVGVKALNSGKVEWPIGTVLKASYFEGEKLEDSVVYRVVQHNEPFNFDVKVHMPNEAGHYVIQFHTETKDGLKFGDAGSISLNFKPKASYDPEANFKFFNQL